VDRLKKWILVFLITAVLYVAVFVLQSIAVEVEKDLLTPGRWNVRDQSGMIVYVIEKDWLSLGKYVIYDRWGRRLVDGEELIDLFKEEGGDF